MHSKSKVISEKSQLAYLRGAKKSQTVATTTAITPSPAPNPDLQAQEDGEV